MGWAARGGRGEDWPAGAGLRCPADVAMMQATDFGDGDNPAEPRRLDWPALWGILFEREMSSCTVIVGEVRGQKCGADGARPARGHDQGTRAGLSQ